MLQGLKSQSSDGVNISSGHMRMCIIVKKKNAFRQKFSAMAQYCWPQFLLQLQAVMGTVHCLTLFMLLLQNWSIHTPEKSEQDLTGR